MLLLRTEALCAHLSSVSTRLPDELWAAVVEPISAGDSGESESPAEPTIPHRVLVEVGKWARSQKGEDRGEDYIPEAWRAR